MNTSDKLVNAINKAKEIIGRFKGRVCIVSMVYENDSIVRAIIEFKDDSLTIGDIKDIEEITIIKSIHDKVFHLKIKV